MKRLLILVLIILGIFCFSLPALALDMRILLDGESNTVITAAHQGEYTLVNLGTGMPLQSLSPGSEVKLLRTGGVIRVLVNGQDIGLASQGVWLRADSEDALFIYKGIKYRGSLQIWEGAGGLSPVNILDIEKYLYGVVGQEIGYGAETEALKAQAVASRSYALFSRNPAAKFDVRNTTGSQLYGGYNAEIAAGGAAVVAAVSATAGEVLYYRNPGNNQISVVPGYYHANSGGHTEHIENVWGKGEIPLKGVPSNQDAYAAAFSRNTGQSWAAAQYQWEVSYTPQQLEELAKKYSGRDIGTFQGLKTSQAGSASGRLLTVEIQGSKDSVSASKDNVRSLLGGLKSSFIQVADGLNVWLRDALGNLHKGDNPAVLKAIGADGLTYAVNGSNQAYYVAGADGVIQLSKESSGTLQFYGRGHGHGVGMSQWGARGMAQEGYDYRQILLHYYTDGNPGNIYLDTF